VQRKPWLFFAVVTTLFWGVWGAFISAPESAGFPNTLSYCVWALTTIPCSLIALRSTRWKLDHDGRSIYLGSMVGFLGAGGQVVLFLALRMGPAYLIFPLISLYPVITVFLSMALLHERASRRAWSGIILALVAIPALNYVPPDQSASRGHLWIVLSLIVFAAWGVQAYYMKFANESMQAESIYFYMMATAVVLIPAAAWMTDFSKPINWGLKGPFLAAAIQVLNALRQSDDRGANDRARARPHHHHFAHGVPGDAAPRDHRGNGAGQRGDLSFSGVESPQRHRDAEKN
jgi:drug/metabolite transporter (DMT)-like permease